MIGLLTGRIGRSLAGAGALVLAILTLGAVKERRGREKAVSEMKESDYEDASDVRERVRAAKRVRKPNKYRD